MIFLISLIILLSALLKVAWKLLSASPVCLQMGEVNAAVPWTISNRLEVKENYEYLNGHTEKLIVLNALISLLFVQNMRLFDGYLYL